MNNKGFAVSGILYTLLLIFITILIMLLFNFQNKKNILDQLKEETKHELNGLTADLFSYTPSDETWDVKNVQEALDYFESLN